MCDPATIGLILSAAGTGVGVVNQQGALRKQDKVAAQGIRKQQDLQREANARARGQVDEFSQSSPAGEQRQTLEAYMNALRATQPSAEGGMESMGAVNPRFAEQVSGQQADMAARSGADARNMSVIDAASLQRLREGQGINRAASDLGAIGRTSEAEDFLNRLRVSSVQPNPWIGAAGNIMQGAGMMMGMGAPAAPTTAAAANPAGMAAETAKMFKSPYLGSPSGFPGFKVGGL